MIKDLTDRLRKEAHGQRVFDGFSSTVLGYTGNGEILLEAANKLDNLDREITYLRDLYRNLATRHGASDADIEVVLGRKR